MSFLTEQLARYAMASTAFVQLADAMIDFGKWFFSSESAAGTAAAVKIFYTILTFWIVNWVLIVAMRRSDGKDIVTIAGLCLASVVAILVIIKLRLNQMGLIPEPVR